MPGVVEPTEKQTLSNVVILKLVYREQRAVFAFSRTNNIEAYQKYLEGEKLEYDVKKWYSCHWIGLW